MPLKQDLDRDSFAKGQIVALIVGQDGTDYAVCKVDPTTRKLEVLSTLQAGANVVGKVRLVTAAGDEITDDVADALKAILQSNAGVNIGTVDVNSLPDERASSSGLLAADAIIKNSAGTLMGVIMIPDGTNDFTLTIYDNTAASGTVLFKARIAGGSDALVVTGLETKATTGIYADGDAGVGTFEYIVLYR